MGNGDMQSDENGNIKRTAKDSVFTHLFQDKEYLLQLYQALHPDYNLFNWFRRLALAAKMRKLRIDTIRLKLLKIAARVVHSARYMTFKLCSSCAYKSEFFETLRSIRQLQPQLK